MLEVAHLLPELIRRAGSHCDYCPLRSNQTVTNPRLASLCFLSHTCMSAMKKKMFYTNGDMPKTHKCVCACSILYFKRLLRPTRVAVLIFSHPLVCNGFSYDLHVAFHCVSVLLKFIKMCFRELCVSSRQRVGRRNKA